MADKYQLKVTAGPSYSPEDQQAVLVNSESPTRITSAQASIDLTIRVQNYRGASPESLPTSPYFSIDPHKKDLYSLSFSFVPKAEINGHDLVLGNDFDHPIRDRLPPGFDQALKIVQWFIDPGLYGDVRADKPFMYGPMLSSVNTFRVDGQVATSEDASTKSQSADEPGKTTDSSPEERNGSAVEVVEEGALESNDADAANGKTGASIRKEFNIPSTAAARKKHFLTTDNLKDFVFRKDVRYSCDFFNPYLDFNGKFFLFTSHSLPHTLSLFVSFLFLVSTSHPFSPKRERQHSKSGRAM